MVFGEWAGTANMLRWAVSIGSVYNGNEVCACVLLASAGEEAAESATAAPLCAFLCAF